MRSDTEDMPTVNLKRGILAPEAKPSPVYWIVRALIIAAMITAVVVSCVSAGGCVGSRGMTAPPIMGPPAPPHAAPAPDPLYAYLVYGVLVGILGVGVAVAMFVWLPFKRTAIALAAGSVGIVVMCLTVRSVLPYIGWVVLGGLALASIVALIHGRKLIGKLAEAWNHVPENAPTSPELDRFMGKVVKATAKAVLPSVPAAGFTADDGMAKP